MVEQEISGFMRVPFGREPECSMPRKAGTYRFGNCWYTPGSFRKSERGTYETDGLDNADSHGIVIQNANFVKDYLVILELGVDKATFEGCRL